MNINYDFRLSHKKKFKDNFCLDINKLGWKLLNLIKKFKKNKRHIIFSIQF
jgi:hypothetical protein